jgi:hypothetical protein
MSLRDALSQVPWSDLTRAYGAAVDTPEHLLALLADDPEERRRAVDALWPSICHQGTVYEASCAVVPFLIRIMREGPPDGRQSVLYLLAGLAHRDTYAHRNGRKLYVKYIHDSEHGKNDRHAWWSNEAYLRDGGDYQDVRWMVRAHRLTLEGLPDYLILLNSDDRDIVLASLHLLAAFQEASERIVPEIDRLLPAFHIEGEQAQVLEAEALLTLAALLPPESPLWRRHLDRLVPRGQSRPLVRYAAAAALARYRPEATPQEGASELVEAVVEPEALDDLYELLPSRDIGEFSVHVEACQLLSQLEAPLAISGLVRALERGVGRWHSFTAIRVAEALLDTAFFGRWVQHRYWNDRYERWLALRDPARPFGARVYHGHGQFSGSKDGLDIRCSGFAAAEAERLREQFARAGGNGLTDAQRIALEALLRCEPLWHIRHNLLDIYGLPPDRQALESLLKRA